MSGADFNAKHLRNVSEKASEQIESEKVSKAARERQEFLVAYAYYLDRYNLDRIKHIFEECQELAVSAAKRGECRICYRLKVPYSFGNWNKESWEKLMETDPDWGLVKPEFIRSDSKIAPQEAMTKHGLRLVEMFERAGFTVTYGQGYWSGIGLGYHYTSPAIVISW